MSVHVEEGPAQKKIKITPLDEPLKRSDIIYFQKDCLYRKIQDYKVQFDSLNIQYKNLLKQNHDIASTFAILVSNTDSLKDTQASDLLDLDENTLREKLLKSSSNSDVSSTSAILTLKKERDVLLIKNDELSKDLASLKEYYQKLVHDFERSSSDILQRVFKLDENGEAKQKDGNFVKKNEYGAEKPQSPDLSVEQKTNNGNVNSVSVNLPNGHQENSSVSDKKPVETESVSEDTNTSNKKNITIVEAEISHKAVLLQKDLELQDYKNKIVLLDQQIEALNNQTAEQKTLLAKFEQETSDQKIVLGKKSETVELLNGKLELATKSNLALTSENTKFLSKFNALYQERSETDLKIMSKFNELQEKMNGDMSNMEKDLVRIRNQRDSIQAKLNVTQAAKNSTEVIKDLQQAISEISDRISSLEKLHASYASENGSTPSSEMLMNELQELEKAYRTLSTEALKKFDNYLKHDALVVSKLKSEKSRADEKYYAAMRSKESIVQENKTVLKTLTKCNELNAQLKESEKITNVKLDNLNKQLNLSRENEKRLLDINKQSSKKISELSIESNSHTNKYNKVVQENNVLKQENTKISTELQKSTQVYNELQTKFTQLEKKLEKLVQSLQDISENPDNVLLLQKKKGQNLMGNGQIGSSSFADKSQNELLEELDNFRTIVYCSLCSKNWKNTTLKNCGHVFCDECCKERLNSRMRKCPSCTKPFSANDLLTIHL
ncbi:hypothetical protein ACO0QE_001881 [Hanseniaspora vineae]